MAGVDSNLVGSWLAGRETCESGWMALFELACYAGGLTKTRGTAEARKRTLTSGLGAAKVTNEPAAFEVCQLLLPEPGKRSLDLSQALVVQRYVTSGKR